MLRISKTAKMAGTLLTSTPYFLSGVLREPLSLDGQVRKRRALSRRGAVPTPERAAHASARIRVPSGSAPVVHGWT